jgi:hypothetical protein
MLMFSGSMITDSRRRNLQLTQSLLSTTRISMARRWSVPGERSPGILTTPRQPDRWVNKWLFSLISHCLYRVLRNKWQVKATQLFFLTLTVTITWFTGISEEVLIVSSCCLYPTALLRSTILTRASLCPAFVIALLLSYPSLCPAFVIALLISYPSLCTAFVIALLISYPSLCD